MKILAIDTTTSVMHLALSINDKIMHLESNAKINEYESIINYIDKLLKKAKVDIKKIDYFGVCTGPGSFTGIRIGVSTIKSLAYSLNKPVVPFNSLDLLARTLRDDFKGRLCVMRDAKRNNIYCAMYKNNSKLSRISPYMLIEMDSLLREISAKQNSKDNLYFYEDMASVYRDKLAKHFVNSISLLQKEPALKSIAMISLIKENMKSKIDSFKVKPFYMYPKDCQVRKV